MGERSLETVLREKYSLQEQFIAEGRFVAVSDYAYGTAELVGIGISPRCVVVAKVNLGESEGVDYDLTSLTPVSLCRVEIRPRNSFTLGGPINPPRHFMQCSCEDMDDVWEKFVHAINAINTRFGSGIWGWRPAQLQAGDTLESNFNQNCLVSEFRSPATYHCLVPESRNATWYHIMPAQHSGLAIESESLSIEEGPMDEYVEVFRNPKGHLFEPDACYEEVTFDSFVNDMSKPKEKVEPTKCFNRQRQTSVEDNKGQREKHDRRSLFGKLCGLFKKLPRT